MPVDSIPTESPNPPPGTEPEAPSAPVPAASKSPNVKRRKLNLDWKSQGTTAEGYSISKRVVLGPGVEKPSETPVAMTEKQEFEPAQPVQPGTAPSIEAEAKVEEQAEPIAPAGEQVEGPVEIAPTAIELEAKAPEGPYLLPEAPAPQFSPELPTFPESDLSFEGTQMAAVRVCPYLGLRTDRSTHFMEPSDLQVCYSPIDPGDVTVAYQTDYCCSPNFVTCPRYKQPEEPEIKTEPSVAGLPLANPPLVAAVRPIAGADGLPARRRSRVFDFVLWGIAIALALVAVWFALPILVGSPATPTTAPVALAPSPTASLTATPSNTPLPLSPAIPTLAPLIIPTPSENQIVLDLLPDASLTGWISSNESEPHWGDPGLNVGTLKGLSYVSILQFNLKNLPPGSKVQFGVLELTGSDASHLAKNGDWRLEVLPSRSRREWLQASATDIGTVNALATIGQGLTPTDLAVGHINRFSFGSTELQLLDNQFQYGTVTFRLSGPATTEDNLFAWDAGSKSSLNAPALHLVVEPGQYTVVTNTPFPQNVITAAAYVVKETANATRFGTPTPFPPGVATATPGGETIYVPAATALSGNVGTAIARSVLATAIALTTGTYTPAPSGLIIIYPTATPFLIDATDLATPTEVGVQDFAKIRASTQYHALLGSIVALSNTFAGCKDGCPIVLNTGGGVLGQLSSDLYYKAALDRDQYSLDGNRRIVYVKDSRGIQQVGYYDATTGATKFITQFQRGPTYDASWSNDGGSIAFVSQETGCDDIYYYDLGSGSTARVTSLTGLGCPFVKHPSWSPDGQNIVFWSSYGGPSHLWIANRGGQGLVDLTATRGQATETNPVWVK